jgi:hypothetical protein
MATTSNRTTTITYTGDTIGTEPINAAANLASPGWIQLINLANGANTITVPVGGAAVTVAVTIVPPAANTNALVLKGVGGDTGVSLHLTDPTTIALASTVVTFVINSTGITTGLRLIWS